MTNLSNCTTKKIKKYLVLVFFVIELISITVLNKFKLGPQSGASAGRRDASCHDSHGIGASRAGRGCGGKGGNGTPDSDALWVDGFGHNLVDGYGRVSPPETPSGFGLSESHRSARATSSSGGLSVGVRPRRLGISAVRRLGEPGPSLVVGGRETPRGDRGPRQRPMSTPRGVLHPLRDTNF